MRQLTLLTLLRPRERRAAARADGWAVRRIDGKMRDLCPECLKWHDAHEELTCTEQPS